MDRQYIAMLAISLAVSVLIFLGYRAGRTENQRQLKQKKSGKKD